MTEKQNLENRLVEINHSATVLKYESSQLRRQLHAYIECFDSDALCSTIKRKIRVPISIQRNEKCLVG